MRKNNMATKKKGSVATTVEEVDDLKGSKWAKDFVSFEDELDTVFQETGVVGFDLAISNGRGLPVGGCILLYSAPGSGKSTLCVDIAKRMLAMHEQSGIPYKCLFVDVEGGSKGLVKQSGLASYVTAEHGRRLLYRPSKRTTWNDIEDYCKAILEDDPLFKDVKLIIIDSLSSIMSETMADEKKAVNAGDFGSSAKDRYVLYNKYFLDLKSKGVTILLIAQQRTKQGATMFEDPKKAATADGDDHIVDTILKLSRTQGGQNADTKKVDVMSTASNASQKMSKQFFINIQAPVKNRYGAYPAVPVLVKIGTGIINRFTIKNMLLSKGISLMKEGGSKVNRTYTVDEELLAYIGDNSFVQGSDRLTTNNWITAHVEPIKEFLKSKDLYKVVLDEDAIVEDDD